ncbi:MAG: hypothetical protein QM692_21010 [Thermomicrobiales bacterium]
MDTPNLNTRSHVSASLLTRRGLAALLGGAGLTAQVVADAASKRKKRKNKKKKKRNKKTTPITPAVATFCLNGETVQRPVNDTAGVIADGAFTGACPQDTCAGGCAAGQVCHAGTCKACTVTCGSATPAQCGNVLQSALNAGGEVIACPGRYAGGFATLSAVTLIGAGAGSNPATSTVLDGGNTQQILAVTTNVNFVAHQVRFTGGNAASGGAIVTNGGVSLTSCVVNSNTSTGSGGGIYQHSTATAGISLANSVFSGNSSGGDGGGVYALSAFFPLMVASSVFIGNSASQRGGAISRGSGQLTLDSASRITGNIATLAGGALDAPSSTELNGALIFGNSSPQCTGGVICPE